MNWKGYLNYLKLSTNHIAKVLFLLIFLFVSKVSYAQADTSKTAYPKQSDSFFVMQKSPGGAVLRSAVIPGWGQIYNHSYIKAPIIWGLGAWLTYLWIWNNNNYKSSLNNYSYNINQYNYYSQKYETSKNISDYNKANQYNNLASSYYSNKNFYQDQRDLVAIYMGITYLLNLVDAYVDAELFDFSVQKNAVSNAPMLNVRINF